MICAAGAAAAAAAAAAAVHVIRLCLVSTYELRRQSSNFILTPITISNILPFVVGSFVCCGL